MSIARPAIHGFKPPSRLPLIQQGPGAGQRGATLIAVIFVMTALLLLGGLMTHLLVSSTEETINEWYSAQALNAAESGVEWSIYNGGGSTTDRALGTGNAWFTVSVVSSGYAGGQTLYIITSIGEAGGTATDPRSQRRIVVTYLQ